MYWYNLGTIYGDLGDYRKAIEFFQRSIQINSNNEQLGNYQKAKECYQKAIQINPDNEYAWANIREIS